MNKKKQYGLLTGLCVFVVLVFIYIKMGTAPEDTGNDVTIYQAAHPFETITCKNRNGTSWTLVHAPEGWVWSEDSSFPVNQEMAAMMAEVLSGPEVVTDMEMTAENRKRCGLDPPEYMVTAAGKEERYTLYFGDRNSTTGDYYFCVEGTDRIYTTDQRNVNIFRHDLPELAEVETLPGVRLDQVSGFQIFRNTITLSLKRETDHDGTRWQAEDGAGHIWQAESIKAEETVSLFLRLKLAAMAVFSPTEAELRQYGLQSPEAVLTLAYDTEGEKCRFALAIGNPDASGAYRYCWFENSKGIYLVEETGLQDLLNRSAQEHADLYLAAIRPESVNAMELILPDAVHQINLSAGADAAQNTVLWNGTELETDRFYQFYYELYGLKGDKLTDPDQPEQERTLPGEEVLRIMIETENGSREQLVFLTYDQNYDLAEKDGTLQMLVNRQKINALIRLIGETAP